MLSAGDLKLATMVAILAAGLGVAPLRGQQAEQSFEVISIKPNNTGDRRTGFLPLSGDRFVATNVTVTQMIQFAYKLQDFQIIGSPAWTKDKRFDLEAKAPPNTAAEEVPSMLQSLLKERFHLSAHTNNESLPVYFLEEAGSKLRDAASCAAPANPCTGMTVYPEGRLIGRDAEIKNLVGILSFLLSRPVLDDTHLTGKYDFELRWHPDSLTRPLEGTANEHVESNDPDIFAAVPQQLGLKLKSGKAPATVLRVDRVEEPTEN